MRSKLFWRNIIWALIIFILCSMPGKELPHSSMFQIPYFDKMVHFGLFFIMGIFLCSEMNFQTKWKSMTIAIVALGIIGVYGGGIEILQHYYFDGRSGDPLDLFADMGGGVISIVLYPSLKKQKDSLLNSKPLRDISFLRKLL